MVLNRVLGRDYQERLRKLVAVGVNSDLALVHGFEKGGLGLGRGAVDLVGHQNVGEDGAAFEFKFLFGGRVNRDPENVGGKHVAGELYAMKAASERTRHGVGQSGLADSGYAFDQEMPASQHRYQRQADYLVLAAYDFLEFIFQAGGPMRRGNHAFEGHGGDSTMRKEVRSGYLGDS